MKIATVRDLRNNFPRSNKLLAPTVTLDVDAWETLFLDLAASRLGKAELTLRLRDLVPTQS